jgi:hypothetical protein
VIDLVHSRLYARSADEDLLKKEADYVQIRYYTIIKTIMEVSFRWTRQQAADFLHISKRHMQRLVKAFRLFGIPGLVVDIHIGHPPHSNILGCNSRGVT